MPTITFCKGNHVLVGLGGTGGKILRAFKMRMFEEFPTHEERSKQPVALLYVDSTDEMMPQDGRPRPDFRVMGQDASFTQNEFLNIKAVDVEHILDHINNYPPVKGIVDNVQSVKSAIGSLGQAAGQKRRAGRLLFAANAVGYVNALRNAYARANAISGVDDPTTIHIFAGLSGGTGSGSIVDAIVQTRKTFPSANILAYVMLPELHLPKADMDQGRYYPNGYAALNELNALQAGRWFPHDVTGNGPARYYSDRVHGVADGLIIYSNVNENGVTINSLKELPKVLSDFVFAKVFLVNEENSINEDVIKAFKCENMDDFPNEYDEAANPGPDGRIPVARTKKINSFGIKRVMYPELRVLKHITYTVGESILYQFKYNNWHENKGFVNEERNKDYRRDYLNGENLTRWMLDDDHLTLDVKILPSDTDYPRFNDYWHDKAIGYADEARRSDCPLNELDNIMNDFYTSHFREDGVENYFAGKERAIPEMAREIRYGIEHGLYEKWNIGDVSIVELQKVSRLLIEKLTEIRSHLEEEVQKEKDNLEAIDADRLDNVKEWSDLGVLQRMINRGARLYADHQGILTDYYVSKTRLVALEFAKKLAAKLFVEVGKMDTDISTFAQKINDAIAETERLITAQRKVNKGLEDMKGAIIEVSEDETMVEFENDIQVDKTDMPKIANELRSAILPDEEFVNFGRLAQAISIDEITDAFDIKLSEIVRRKHDEKADAEQKVLGLNILTQLQQKLKTDDEIKMFASKIVTQSGAYLKLNNDQMQLHLRNNEGNLSPSNPASINKKVILVSIPSPDDNPGLKKFADKLESAFKDSFSQNNSRLTLVVNRESPRKDELSILTVGYCFPMRGIDWMKPYKERYENFLNSGNAATDLSNSILLHSEGTGQNLPSLFAVDNAEEKAAAEADAKESEVDGNGQSESVVPPVAPPAPPTPSAPPVPPTPEPEVSVTLLIGGAQYGPYNYAQCKQFSKTGQLTAQTMVWMPGMPAWAPAAQVPELAPLFAPAMPPAPPAPPATPQAPPMPPMPPVG